MKRLITIILALIMTLISAPNQGADKPHVTAIKPPQTAITEQVEQVPEESETTAETAFVDEVSETEIAVETEELTVTERRNCRMHRRRRPKPCGIQTANWWSAKSL